MTWGKKHSQLMVVIILSGWLLGNPQAALAEGNYSAGRTWGIGVFPPNTLSVRCWLSDTIGLEGAFSLLYGVGRTSDQGTGTGSLTAVGIGVGPLLKLTDGQSWDIYAGVQPGLIGAVWALTFDDYADADFILLPGAAAIAGLEVSPSPHLSLSLEVGLWISYMETIIIMPARIPMFLFPGIFNLGLHYYF